MESALEIFKNLIINKKSGFPERKSYVAENIDTLLWKPLSEHGSQKLAAACLSSFSKEKSCIVISSKDYSMMVSMIQLGILVNIPVEQFRAYLVQEMQSFLKNKDDDNNWWSLVKIFIEWHRKLFFLLKNEKYNTRENVVFLLLAEYFKTNDNQKATEDLFLQMYRKKENENKARDIVECLFLSFMIRDLVPSTMTTLVSLQDHIVYSKSDTVFFKSKSCVQFYDRFLYTHLQDLYEQKRKKKTQTKENPSEFIRSVKKLWDKELRLFESQLKLPTGMISKIEIVFLNNMITGYMDTFKEWLFASSLSSSNYKKDKEFFETVQMFSSLYLSQSRPECSMEYQKVLVEWFTKTLTGIASSLEELVNLSLTINNNLPSHMRYLSLAFSETNCMQDKIHEYVKVLDMFIRESKDIKSGTSPFSRFSFNDDIITMFSYIKDKDIFLEEYRNQMAMRLLRDSVKIDNEKTVLGYIKNQMGPSFTMKLEKMLQDVTATAAAAASDSKILLYSSWPEFMNVNVNVNISSANNLFSEITNEYKRRVADFEEKHDGHRILAPIFTEGQVCLRFSPTTTTWIDITCNPIQAMVLTLVFERELLFKDLCNTISSTSSEQSIIKALIQPLLKMKLVLESEGGEEKLYSFNKDFKSKLRSIHVPQIVLKKTSRENIDMSRNEVINACIVRILKTRKRIEHEELVREVISFTSRLFVIQPRQVKQQINELIDREYLERESSSIYKYLA